MKKKLIIILVALLVLALGISALFSQCQNQESMTASNKLILKMKDNVSSAKSFRMKAISKVDMSFKQEDEYIPFYMDSFLDAAVVNSPAFYCHMNTSANSKGLGEEKETAIKGEIYCEETGGYYYTYVSTDSKKWDAKKTSSKPNLINIEKMIRLTSDGLELNQSKTTDNEFVLEGVSTSSNMGELLNSFGAQIKSDDISYDIPIEMIVDRKTILPKKMILKKGDASTTDSATKDSAKDDFTIHNIEIVVEFSMFNEIHASEVPDDIRQQAKNLDEEETTLADKNQEEETTTDFSVPPEVDSKENKNTENGGGTVLLEK